MKRTLREPEVIIVWTPSDGQVHMVGAHFQRNKWSYSGPSIMAKSEMNGFIGAMMNKGFAVFDVQRQAEKIKRGMSHATPILLYRRVTLHQAVEMYAKVHLAIINRPD